MSSEKISAGPPQQRPRHCPECGAKVHNAQASKCWLCAAELTGLDTAVESAEDRDLLQRIRMPEDAGPPIIVTILAFAVLFIAICVGLAMTAPGLLIVLLVIATPAIFRTALTSSRARPEGAPRSAYAVIGTFLGSLAAVVIAGLAAFAAFAVACFLVCIGGLSLGAFNLRGGGEAMIYLGLSVVIGLAMGGLVLWQFWKRKG